MRLAQFRVTKFRNIIDSGPIDVDDLVTCLVGMNESGKTTILAALHRLNPVDGAEFDVQRDYPRWLLVKDRRATDLEYAEPITAEFALDDAEKALVAEHLGEAVLTREMVTISRAYKGFSNWVIGAEPRTAVENLLQNASARKKTLDEFKAVTDFDGIEEVCARLVANTDDGQAETTAEEIARIRSLVASMPGKTVTGSIRKLLEPRLPRFFYFSDYSILEGRVDVQTLKTNDEQTASSPEQTARALLALAGTTPDALAEDDYEDRKAELEAVGHDLTEQVFEYWKQNPNLRVQFDIDRKIEQDAYGNLRVPAVFLDIRVEDTRHAFTNNFSYRSSGFRWFFSFLAAFTEFEQANANIVVLLDEPGLTLHGRAQADFLRFINERLASAVQVLYTTHSPFMVETDKIDRVRIVEDQGPKTGATVTREALTVGEGSLFPLQAALGYDVAQHLFIGDTNLLVEGPSDFVYLDALSRRLQQDGRTSLDERWRILPAGGAANIPAFISLMGRELEVTVLVDSGTEGANRLDHAIQAGRLNQDRLVRVGEITDSTHADIEDLFTIDDYLLLYNEAFSTTVSPDDLGHGDRIIKRLTDLRGDRFDHHRPADTLLRNPRLLDDLSAETLDAFDRLIQRINATLD